MAANLASRMPIALRIAVKSVATLLWFSGCMWLVLHFFFPMQTEFGSTPNSWEVTVIRVHGIVAISAVFLFGWVVSRHVLDAWWRGNNRISGIAMTVVISILVVSGYALYYVTNESTREALVVTHEVIGVLAVGVTLIHWKTKKR